MTENELLDLIQSDDQMMSLLKIIANLGLKDSWLAAGSVRNYIWNVLSGCQGFDHETDLDVVFYDPDISDDDTLALESNLKKAYPDLPWELKNQVHMHHHSPETKPYLSARDAISKYPETAIALRLNDGRLELYAPFGLGVISRFEIRPTPHFKASSKRMILYHERLAKKAWAKKWPQIIVFQD